MQSSTWAVLVTVAFSAVGVCGDYFLKLASAKEKSFSSIWFYIGLAVYASTAVGWVFVMKHLKLATISVVYSVSMVVMLTAIGFFAFGEPLNRYEVAGLAMAIGALVLLGGRA
jgi:small multidrug resistance pump